MTTVPSFLSYVEDRLALMGDSQITHMTIFQEPLSRVLKTTLNIITLGTYKRNMKLVPFDTFFHAFLVVTTSEGKYKLEKEMGFIRVEKFAEFPKYSNQMDVELKEGEITLNTMLEVTRKHMGDYLFSKFNAADNNCQHFIQSILKSNSMYSCY
jgi:hypothetical protein